MNTFTLKRTSVSVLTSLILAASGSMLSSHVLAASAASADTGAPSTTASAQVGQHEGQRQAKRTGRYKRGMHRHRIDAAMIVPGYGPIPQDVVDTLSLNDKQNELLKNALKLRDQNRDVKRGRKGKAGTRRHVQTITGSVDPHAAVKAQNERFAAMQKMRAEQTGKWLAVWDSLESDQQQRLAGYVKERAETRAEQRSQRKAEHQKRRAERRSAQN